MCLVIRLIVVLFCFKQKTAYEMRISDWSSDVCSSDLFDIAAFEELVHLRRDVRHFLTDPLEESEVERLLALAHSAPSVGLSQPWRFVRVETPALREPIGRASCRERVVSTCRSRWSPYH